MSPMAIAVLRFLAFSAAFLVAAPAGQARSVSGASPAPGRTLATVGQVYSLSADGGRVAMLVGNGYRPMVVVWNPASGSLIHLDPTARTGGASVYDLALGGNTVAWVNTPRTGAHETPMLVERARLDRPSSPPAVAEFAWSPDGGTGNLLGDLRSGGSLVAFDTYYLCTYGDGLDCPPGYAEYATYGEQVWLLDIGTPGACASIPSGADPEGGDITFARDPSVLCRKVVATDGTSTVLAVGGGRLAISRSDRTVQLVDELGNAVSTVTSTLGKIDSLALDGNQVDLLVRARQPWRAVLEVHDAQSGALEHSWTLARTHTPIERDPCEEGCLGGTPHPSLRLEGAAQGVVAYILDGTLHLLRLSDGRSAIVTRSRRGLLARLDGSGLFYSYQVDDKHYPGRVVHVSRQALTGLLDGD
jgi:hypothetical protein